MVRARRTTRMARGMRTFRSATMALLFLGTLSACATLTGAAVGTGIGAMAGDPRQGMAIGATTGALVGIFGRR
jgi:uncharacterized membrane protein